MQSGRRGYGFFDWFDAPICVRARQVIPGLLRRVQALEEMHNAQKKREKKLLTMLVVAVFMILWMMC